MPITSTVNLDSTYFAANPTPPWVLGTPNTKYVLQQNASYTGTYTKGRLFQLAAKNVQLVLNGFGVYLNGVRMNQPTNSSFRDSQNAQRSIQANDVVELGGSTTQILSDTTNHPVLP